MHLKPFQSRLNQFLSATHLSIGCPLFFSGFFLARICLFQRDTNRKTPNCPFREAQPQTKRTSRPRGLWKDWAPCPKTVASQHHGRELARLPLAWLDAPPQGFCGVPNLMYLTKTHQKGGVAQNYPQKRKGAAHTTPKDFSSLGTLPNHFL